MLFFPPTADLASSVGGDPSGMVGAAATAAASMAMDGLLLGGALLPRPSAIEEEQRNQQQAQLQQQIFAMEQQLQQQSFPGGPSSFLPLLGHTIVGHEEMAKLKGNCGTIGGGLNGLHLEGQLGQHCYQERANLLIQPFALHPACSSSNSSPSNPAPVPALPHVLPPDTCPGLVPLLPAAPGPPPQMMAMPPSGPCGLCRLPIQEKNFLLVDSQCWHLDCVRCSTCGQNLEELGSSCFTRDGFLYCRRDYLMKFGRRCERCTVPIERGEFVMRVPRCTPSETGLFHVHCFSCICCGQLLSPGEQFTVGPAEQPGGLLFCRAHFHLNPVLGPPPSGHFPPPPSAPPHFPGLNQIGPNLDEPHFLVELNPLTGMAMQKQQQEQQPQENCGQPPSPEAAAFGQQIDSNKENPTTTRVADQRLAASVSPNGADYGCDNSGGDVHSNGDSSGQKQKRMRTSFKHHQLRTMKAYFNLNHNPDAKDLKQLAQKTGLTKRVLQVWFQNARAKYRRNQQHKMGGSICAGSMLDQPPPSAPHSHHLLMQMGTAQQSSGMMLPAGMLATMGGAETQFGLIPPNQLQHGIGADDPVNGTSLSPADGSSLGCSSSISLNAGGSSADEQSSEKSFQ